MTTNPKKEAFKKEINAVLRDLGPDVPVPKADLKAAVRKRVPQLFDDAPCYPKCNSHKFAWGHVFVRCIYDLTNTRPPKIVTAPGKKGHYQLYVRPQL